MGKRKEDKGKRRRSERNGKIGRKWKAEGGGRR
jgi:hypothetical protein